MKNIFLKITFFCLVSMYVFATVGVCVIAHYCEGELEKVSLFSKPSSCCDGQNTDTDDCCKNDSKHVVLKADFTFFQLVHECKAPVTDLFLLPGSDHFVLENISQSYNIDHQKFHPPNLVQDDIVSHTVIRI